MSSPPHSTPGCQARTPLASTSAMCMGTKQLPLTAWTVPKVQVMHRGPHRLRAT